jgi:hypothetical protein
MLSITDHYNKYLTHCSIILTWGSRDCVWQSHTSISSHSSVEGDMARKKEIETQPARVFLAIEK